MVWGQGIGRCRRFYRKIPIRRKLTTLTNLCGHISTIGSSREQDSAVCNLKGTANKDVYLLGH